MCLEARPHRDRGAKKKASCFRDTQVPGSGMSHCNAHSSLESNILCFTSERNNQKCLSAVKYQAMAMIDQDQDLYDSLATLRNTQSRGQGDGSARKGVFYPD